MATKRSPKSSSKSRRRRYLSSEIVLEILSRVPTRPLLRFQSASKSWFSLIGQNLIQSRALPSSLYGFFYHRGHTVGHSSGDKKSPPFYTLDNHQHPEYDIDMSLSFLPTLQEHMIWKETVDSCNGLLLVRSCSYRVADTVYYVCNPATKRWTVLPPLPPTGYTTRLLLRLAYDPVASSAHYMVIMVPFLASGFMSQQEILIFSSENRDRGWISHTPLRRINLDVLSFQQNRPGAPVLNGALYITHGRYVMRYKLLERVQHKIKLPDNHDAHHFPLWKLPFLGVLGGSICCAMLAELDDQFNLRIWTLVEESDKKRKRGTGSGASWVLRHNVELQFGAPIVLAFHPFSELVLLQTREQGIWGYDLNRRTRVGVGAGKLRSQIWLECSNEAFPYTPCFYGCFDEGDICGITPNLRGGQDITGNSNDSPPSNLEPSTSNGFQESEDDLL